MATKISNLEELREEKMRLQLQLSHQEETLLRHYTGFKRQLTPIASLLNQLGWLGNKTGDTGGPWYMSLLGTALKIGLPLVANRFFPPKSAGNGWSANLLEGLGNLVNSELFKSIIDQFTHKTAKENTEQTHETTESESGLND